MNPQIWKAVGRWLLAVVACMVSLVVAFIALMVTVILIPQICIRWGDAIRLRMPLGVEMALADLVTFSVGIAIWTIPTVFTIGFALRMPVASRWRWAFTVWVLFLAAYAWLTSHLANTVAPHPFAIGSAAVLVAGVALSFLHRRRSRWHSLGNIVALALLTMPCWLAFAFSPPEPPTARQVWSATLQETAGPDMNTQSEFGARRQAVFVGDRLLVVFDAGSAGYEGNQPMSKYHLLSLDIKMGLIKNSKEFTGHWGAIPTLYATDDGHAIMADGSLNSFNADLTPAPAHFTADRGRVNQMSPDGTTMAWETFPGTTLLDSHTLESIGKHLEESVPTSVSPEGVVTNNAYWYGQYPKEHTFVTLTDEHGQRLIYHSADDCGGPPEFLTREKVLTIGCSKIRVVSIQGRILRETPSYDASGTFAGVSQNGKRFALQYVSERGDPQVLLYDRFVIYDTESLMPVSMVRISDLPERISWSAFSADGHFFVAGKPAKLGLYELP